MFEDACHEGNYGLLNILRGARADEAETGHDGRAVVGEELACGISVSPVGGDRVKGGESGWAYLGDLRSP